MERSGGFSRLAALRVTVEEAAATTGGDPFMGVADPSAPYDLRFLDEMIMHHQGAIMSARGMIADSARPEPRDLARRIIAGQQRQIDQMRAWRQEWYPDAGPPPWAG